MAAKKGLGTGLDILFGESTRAEEEHRLNKAAAHSQS